MARSRVGALDERVRTIRRTVDRLCEEHTVVRERIDAVAATVDVSPDGGTGQAPPEIGSAWTDAGFSTQSESSLPPDGGRRTEASDAEVAAAIPTVTDDGSEEAAETGNDEEAAETGAGEELDEIIVA